MMRLLKAGDFVEFDARVVDGRIVRTGGRLVYSDGTVVPFQLSPDQGRASSVASIIRLMSNPSRRKLFGLAAGVAVAPAVALSGPLFDQRPPPELLALSRKDAWLTLDEFADRILEPAMRQLAANIERDAQRLYSNDHGGRPV